MSTALKKTLPIGTVLSPTHLQFTSRGLDWLSQFEGEDKISAKELLASLTLVSHLEFERSVDRLIRNVAAGSSGPVALFAVRETEVTGGRSLLEQTVDAVPRGAEIGSEGRVAAIIRGIARSDRSKFLNHPNLAELRSSNCRKIILVDDFIGSGKRTTDYLDAIWRSRTIKSWWSRQFIKFEVVAYAGANIGEKLVKKHKTKPTIQLVRDCPTLNTLPILIEARDDLRELCEIYGQKTSKRAMSLGYRGTAALLVFEHGCPNNAPAILWAPSTAAKPWVSLFPSRSVLPDEQSAFPPEIVRRDAVNVLVAAGQSHLARSGGLAKPEPLGNDVLITLALIAKRVRRLDAFSYATGLPRAECISLLENCVRWGLITLTNRLTREGYKELDAARNLRNDELVVPPRGEEDYYPKSLRGHIGS